MNAYHNLAGWLRDVRSALADAQGGNVNPMSGAMMAQLNDLIVDIKLMFDDEELDDDGDVEDADGGLGEADGVDELEDADDDVEVPRSRVSRLARPERASLGHGRTRVVGESATVADDVPPSNPKAGRRGTRRAPAVAAAGKRGVSRGKK